MACPAEQKIKWTCTKFKDDIVTTTSIIEEASIDNNLSDNDLNFYNTIKDRLDIKYQNAVDKIIYRFDEKLSKYSQVKQNRIKELMVDKIEAKISYVLMQYPQDIALPKKVNDRYLTYTLLKFELMK
jgi:CRISPR/Cas system CSM-associated protein Csm3 (group 7 of RAMP superfamily)